jgi:DNA repair and recombination protein RAD52
MFDEDQKRLLAEPLDPANIKSRQGADRRNVSYVESWHIIDEANRIFGFDGWSSDTVEIRPIHEPKLNADNNNVVSAYFARVRVTVYAGDRTIMRGAAGLRAGSPRRPARRRRTPPRAPRRMP